MTLNKISEFSWLLSLALAGMVGASDVADAAGKCRFAKRPPVVLKDMAGFCKFDPGTLTFAGTPAEQARCLLNPVQPVGRLGPAMETLPEAIEKRVGGNLDLPSHATLGALLRDRGATPGSDRHARRSGFARP